MNIATVLKSEISRVARQEARLESAALKKSCIQYRTDIVELTRRVKELERLVTRLVSSSDKASEKSAVKVEKLAKLEKISKAKKSLKPVKVLSAAQLEDAASKVRFSAKGLATQRKRLGLSAANMGKILGVSGGAVYLWEDGKTRPRANQLPAIANLRKMGKKEVAAKLAALETGVVAVDE